MKFIQKHYQIILCSIPVISFILHFHVFNLDLVGIHVWRQAETQTVINNFYTRDFNILKPHINGHADTDQLHRMEFPLMQWLIALIYKLLGPGIIVTRSVIFIIGLCSVYGVFYLCSQIFKNKGIAVIAAWCFNFSPVFYYYTLNPMPDNMALCCGIWYLGFFYAYINTAKIKFVVLSAIFLCIAAMTKLPFIIYVSFILAFITISLLRKDRPPKELLKILLIYLLFVLPAFAWYKAVVPGWDIGAVRGVFDQKWNHPILIDVITGTLVSVLPELLINYGSLLFFIVGLYLIFKNKLYTKPYFMLFAVWGTAIILYFLFEMNIIDVVHDYYLFPFLPPIFIIVAYSAFRLLSDGQFLKKLSLICLVILPFTAYIRADSRWDTKDPGFDPAYFKYKKELRSLTPSNALCVIDNDESPYILLYYIDRNGWAQNRNYLDEKLLSYYISKGASYLFLDTHIDTVAGIKAHLDKKIFDKETLRVYKLK